MATGRRKVTKVHMVSVKDVNWRLKKLQESVDALIKHQRLATIFELQGHGAELSVTPEQFEPNREVLGRNIEKAVRGEDHPQPDVWAYCVLKTSGLDSFLKDQTRRALQGALARLRANGDTDGALAFCREVVNKL